MLFLGGFLTIWEAWEGRRNFFLSPATGGRKIPSSKPPWCCESGRRSTPIGRITRRCGYSERQSTPRSFPSDAAPNQRNRRNSGREAENVQYAREVCFGLHRFSTKTHAHQLLSLREYNHTRGYDPFEGEMALYELQYYCMNLMLIRYNSRSAWDDVARGTCIAEHTCPITYITYLPYRRVKPQRIWKSRKKIRASPCYTIQKLKYPSQRNALWTRGYNEPIDNTCCRHY